jgi:hypothetical protein
MTEDEARRVAQHCIDAWPSGPKAYIWRELVSDLDYGPAVGAYRQLAHESIKAPTTGQFMAHYHAVVGPRTDHRGIRWNGDEIGLGEYLERVQLRATNGNHEAQAEIDRWVRHLTGKRKERP